MFTPREVLHSLIWTRRHHVGRMPVPEFEFVRSFLRDDDLAIDVGAHGGSWTRLLSQALPRGRVYAFEALPYYARVLSLTARLNGWRNATIINRAVSDSPRSVMMVHRDSHGKPLTGLTHVQGAGDATDGTVSVQGITLDSFMGDMRPGHVAFIKLDVEGFELPALRGATRLLETHRPFLWCEVWGQYTQRYSYGVGDLFAFLEARGYGIYTVDAQHGWKRTGAQSYGGSGDVFATTATLETLRSD